MDTAKTADFFLGANSPTGFTSYFAELTDQRLVTNCYVIKGCPGSGKSTMMKQAADRLVDQEKLIERIHCSSDPNSLDAVIFHDSRTILADGTPPHAIEPTLPILYEQVISLFDGFDSVALRGQLKEAAEVNRRLKECHSRCCCYLSGAAMLLEDNGRTAAEATDFLKIQRAAQKLAAKEFPKKGDGAVGLERKRLLSAITPQGFLTFHDTIPTLCERVYLIRDEYAAASTALIRALKILAIESGYEVFCCYSPLDPQGKPEHLLIPALSLAFVSENSCVQPRVEPYRVIHFSRFTDKSKLRLKKQRLSFNKRAAKEILEEAVKSLVKAKEWHDKLEEIYRSGVDFARIAEIQEATVTALEKCCKIGVDGA